MRHLFYAPALRPWQRVELDPPPMPRFRSRPRRHSRFIGRFASPRPTFEHFAKIVRSIDDGAATITKIAGMTDEEVRSALFGKEG